MATGKRRSLLNLPSLENFLSPLPWSPWYGKRFGESVGGTSRFWNYYFVLLTGKWHKGLGLLVVVFNHFWVTHIYKNLMKALHSLPRGSQICAHTQNLHANRGRFTWWITHAWVPQGSVNPSLSITDLNNNPLHFPLICRAFWNLSLVGQLSKGRDPFHSHVKLSTWLRNVFWLSACKSLNFHLLLMGHCWKLKFYLLYFCTNLLTLIPFLP